jgi:chitodextrinase
MKNINNFWVSLLVFVAFCNYTSAQTALGSSKNFLSSLKKELVNSTSRGTGVGVSLKVSDTKNFDAKVNYKKSEVSTEFLIGEIKNVAESSFYVKVMDKSVEGHIILKATKEAYKYYSDENGDAYVTKVDINSIICINYDKTPQNTKTTNRTTQAKISGSLLNLQSFPGAKGCVMLDFDGYNMPAGNLWNNGNPINAAPSQASDAEIQEQWEIVAEDYRPFNINITTNEAVFNSYPKNRRMRVVITPTNTAAPRGGGVAYIGSFNWDNDVPCWVFYNGKVGGEGCSHEIGHTLDLLHDGGTNPKVEYYGGVSGAPWAPIMGVSYYKPITHWSKGEYNSANNKQDDVAIISSAKFGLGYRADDYGNTTAAASNLAYNTSGAVIQTNGIITNEADVDYFTFTTGGGNVALNVNTVARNGDLDVVLRLYNASGAIIGTYTNTTNGALNASLAVNLAAGKYFLAVDGTGAGDVGSGGYSAYASLGSYSITGTIPPGNATNDTQIPTTPTNLVASGTTATTTNLAWNASTDNVGVTAYNVYKANALLTTVTGRTYTASGLTASTAYSFSVRAIDAAGNISVASNTVNITTTAITTPGLPFTSGGIFTLTAKHSGKDLTVNGASQANAANVDQWQKTTGARNQQFKFTFVSGEYYQLQAIHSNKCVDVAGISVDNGANVQQWDCSGGANQLWKFVKQTDGSYVVISKNSGKALDVERFSLVDGANVSQYQLTGGDNQKWIITPVAGASAASASELASSFDESPIPTFPSPFENEINFSSNEKIEASGVKLLNILGQSQDIVLENTNENQYKVNIKNSPASGVYFLKIDSEKSEKTMKVFKK